MDERWGKKCLKKDLYERWGKNLSLKNVYGWRMSYFGVRALVINMEGILLEAHGWEDESRPHPGGEHSWWSSIDIALGVLWD